MINNNKILKKQIVYRSKHRGTKEMDILLSGFVSKYIEKLDFNELNDLNNLLFIEDEILHKWYFEDNLNQNVPITKVSKMLKGFKL